MRTFPNRVRLFCLAIAWSAFAPGLAIGQRLEFGLSNDEAEKNAWAISSIAFSPDGKLVASGHGLFLGMLQEPKPGLTVLWDAVSGKRVRTIPAVKDGVHAVAFSPDGKILGVLEYPGIIRLISIADGREIRTLETGAKDRGFGSFAFFPDGKRIVAGVGASQDGPGNDLMMMDVGTGKCIRILNGHRGPVQATAISADGKLVASGAQDGTVILWDAAAGKVLKRLHFESLRKRVKKAAGLEAEGIGAEGLDYEIWVQSVAFSPDGRTLATVAGLLFQFEEVGVWDVSTGKLKQSFKEIDPTAERIVFSADGKSLAIAGRSETITFRNVADAREFVTIKGIGPIAISPDGRRFARGKVSMVKPGDVDTAIVKTIVIEKTPTPGVGRH